MSDRLLSTKFYPPPVREKWVPRTRLFQRLQQVFSCGAGLVSAPAGFGKSTLLSGWLNGLPQEKYASSWISLESSDNDLYRFFGYFIAAWQRIYPGAGAAAKDDLHNFPAPTWESLAIMLLNDLANIQDNRHGLLVLDDYHLVDNREVHELVAYFIEHLPANIHIILATRTDPPLPLARWRSRGCMVELRVDDLRFTPSEAVQFFSKSMQLDLAENQVQVLEERTEGWVVGLQMAALSLQEHKNPHQFVQAFSGTHRYILDYLLEEVINRQPEEVQRFLLETSLLNSLSWSLCDAVLECQAGASQQMLERLERENLFIVPLDDERSWYRYHHLFAELLRVRLRQRIPERIRPLYGRAADWYASQGSWREAIDYALLAGHMEQASYYFEQAMRTGGMSFLVGRIGPLIERFPAEQINARPLLGLADAMARFDRAQLDGIEMRLKSIEQAVVSGSEEESDEILSMIYAVQSMAALLLGDCSWTITAAQKALEHVPLSNYAGALALIQLGFGHFFLGHLHQTEECAIQVVEANLKPSNRYSYLRAIDGLGRLRHHKGDLLRAEKDFLQGLEIGASYRDRFPHLIGGLLRDYADLLREYNQLDKAFETAESALDICRKFEGISGQGLAYIHMARIQLARGNLKGAVEAWEEANRLCKTHSVYFDLRVNLQELFTDLCLAQDRPDEAWQGLDECQKEIPAAHILLQEWIEISRARVLLYQKRPEDAIKLLSNRASQAAASGRGRNQLEILLLIALAGYSIRFTDDALKRLAEALTLAKPQGFARIFIDKGADMARMLQEGLAKHAFGSCSAYARSLLQMFEKPGAPAAQPFEGEQLSTRELEVLQMICDGLSNQEIAARLYLTVGTVKSHVHHIFGKMGVENRPQAIALARQFGFFEP